MWATLLSSAVAAIVNALLGRFFPGHPKITPEATAQAQRDRADTLQSQKDAHREADTLRNGFSGDIARAADSGLLKPDRNELPPG